MHMSQPAAIDDLHYPRRVTAVAARPFKVCDLAPGIPYITRNGDEFTFRLEGLPPQGAEFTLLERMRFAINLRRVGVKSSRGARVYPDADRSLAQWPDRVSPVLGAGRAGILRGMRFLPKAIAVGVITLLAVAGVSRFVHIDIAALTRTIHIGLPHFLTPWRAPDLDPTSYRGASSDPMTGATGPSLGALDGTPQPLAGGEPAGGSNTAQPTGVRPTQGTLSTHWLPMPGGPLPVDMPTYGDRDSGQVHLNRPYFRNSDSGVPDQDEVDADEDESVRLLGQTSAEPAPNTSATETSSEETKASPPESRPSDKAVAHPVVHPAPRKRTLAPTVVPPAAPMQPPAPKGPVDVVLLQQAQTPAATQDAPQTDGATGDASTLGVATVTADAPAPDTEVHPGSNGRSSGPNHPSFPVITHTEDSLVVMDAGKMKQIPIGATLPDGSKLLGVSKNGGGFTSTRGSFAAY